MEKQSFLRDHADTIAIIGVNLALAGFILSLVLMNMSNITASNSRMDAANARIDNVCNMIYEIIKEGRK